PASLRGSELPRTVCHDSKNAAICCSRRYEKRSKRWAATCVLLLNSRIVRRSWCLNYPRTNRPANRLGDMRTLSLKIPFALATVKGRPACAAPIGRCGPQKLRQTSKSTSYSESASDCRSENKGNTQGVGLTTTRVARTPAWGQACLNP